MVKWPEIPARLRHYLDREGLRVVGKHPMFEVRSAMSRALPTLEHAVRLFDAVAERLGDRAHVEGGATEARALYLRDPERPEWLVGLPLLELTRVVRIKAPRGTVTVVGPDGETVGTKPAPAPPPERHVDIAPVGQWARSGDLAIRSSAAPLTVSYDDRGVVCGSTWSGGDPFTWSWLPLEKPLTIDALARPPQLLPCELLCREDASEASPAWTIEALADIVAAFELAPHTPLRVRIPAALPGGARAVIQRALRVLRGALFADVDPSAGTLIVDGFGGTAIARGATFDEALTAWQRELFRVRPKPPAPAVAAPRPPRDAPTASSPSARAPAVTTTGTTEYVDKDGKLVGMSFGRIGVDLGAGGGAPPSSPLPPPLPWPVAIPTNTPGVLVPLGQTPEIPPGFLAAGFTRWARVVGEFGHVRHVLVRDDARGQVLVGEGILDLLDPATLDAALDAFAVEHRERGRELRAALPDIGDPYDTSEGASHLISVWDEGHHRATPPTSAGDVFSSGFDPGRLDGDLLPWRIRWTRRFASAASPSQAFSP